MDNNMTVDMNQPQSAPVDAALATVTAQDNTTALSEALTGSVGSVGATGSAAPLGAQEAAQAQEAQDLKVDKGFQGRVNAQVQKAVAQETAALRSEYEGRIAALQQMTFSREADALVAGGKFTDRDMALEYVQLKYGGGVPAQPQAQAEQPAQSRDGQGRFSPAQPAQESAPPYDAAREQLLLQQAATIQSAGGPDMRQILRDDEIIGTMVASGRWDLNRALQEWQAKQGGQAARNGPPPVRSANHTNTRKSFKDMTPQEFEAFRQRVQNGEKFDARR